jgi:NarL family two-component system response regulator LiaR
MPMTGRTAQENRDEEIRVLIADDHAIVRKGLRALLATEPGIAVVGEAQNGQEAIDQALRLKPHVVLMDLVMPGIDGLAAIRHLAERQPETRVLVLTSFDGDEQVLPAIKAGARGYLLKDSGPEQLVDAIQQVHCGRSALHPAIAHKLLQHLSPSPSRASASDCLTEREIEVLRLVAGGLSNREISNHLDISEATVRTHVSNILGKLELCSRTQAALFALREGLASLQPSTAPQGS